MKLTLLGPVSGEAMFPHSPEGCRPMHRLRLKCSPSSRLCLRTLVPTCGLFMVLSRTVLPVPTCFLLLLGRTVLLCRQCLVFKLKPLHLKLVMFLVVPLKVPRVYGAILPLTLLLRTMVTPHAPVTA